MDVVSVEVGDGQTVRLSLLSFGGRLSADSDDDIMESPAKTCYEVGAVQVSDARYTYFTFLFYEACSLTQKSSVIKRFTPTITGELTHE